MLGAPLDQVEGSI